jgi:prepilin-type N-terminal cleavage/methylation domain-containing protein
MTRRGFTLIELLAVIGVLVALAAITAVSVQRIGQDTRMTKAVNDLLNVLETARGLAIRTHQPVMVAFRARAERFDETTVDIMKFPNAARIKRRWTEAVIGRLEEPMQRKVASGDATRQIYIDRFVPEPGLLAFAFPEHFAVAGSFAGFGNELYDRAWVTQPKLTEDTSTEEKNECGSLVAVIFDDQGRVITRLDGSGLASLSQGRYPMMDFNRNGVQDILNEAAGAAQAHIQDQEGDEPHAVTTQTLAVFDDKAAREAYDDSRWAGMDFPVWSMNKTCSQLGTGQSRKICEQSEFIEQFGTRIQFNRNTGRAEVQQR